MSILTQPHFHSETAARERLEKLVWKNGPQCPRCKGFDRITPVKGGRPGLRRCGPCKREFTVTVGTIFERSKVALHKWFQAAHLLASSKKGISAHQLHRTLRVTYKTAWFMEHRLREAMQDLHADGLLGGEGKTIESDETYWGPKDIETNPMMKGRRRGKPGPGGKAKIMTLVERGGRARSVHVADLTNRTMQKILLANADTKSRLVTDEWTAPSIGLLFAKHETIKHSAGEYARGDVTTNTVEGYFSVFKRGMRGTYQHCKEKHLHRYLAEFDFRYNERAALGINDEARADRLISGIVGKRLMYRDSSVA